MVEIEFNIERKFRGGTRLKKVTVWQHLLLILGIH